MIKIKVPARICFYGDHQDYLGLPVIAGTINRFINLKAVPNFTDSYKIKLPNIKKTISISLNEELKDIKNGDYFRSCLNILIKKGLVFKKGYDIEICGDIPINAGLSSSSALVVCWLRFLITSQENTIKFSDFEIGHLAYEAETNYFKQPGGLMDQYTIAQGGLLYIDTKSGKSSSLKLNIGFLIVAESAIVKQTLEVLKNAKTYARKAIGFVKKQNPDFHINETTLDDYHKYLKYIPNEYRNHWYAAIYNYDITKKALLELENEAPNYTVLGNLMNEHQQILEEKIKNTPIEMIKMMNSVKMAGAIGTKIVGSGGGGCMVAMVEENLKDDVISTFKNNGAYKAYEVSLVNM